MITPGDSDSEDANKLLLQTNQIPVPTMAMSAMFSQPAADPAFSHAPEMVDGYRSDDIDMDMDMDGADNVGPHVGNLTHLGPGHSQPDPIQPGAITSRMPTPIHCSFAAQVRGANWSGAAGNAMQPSAFGPPPPAKLIPRSLDHHAMADWNVVQNRRLPSPISESGCEEIGSPGMMLDSQLLHGIPPRSASAMDYSAPPRTPSALSTVSDVTGESSSSSSSSSHTHITDPGHLHSHDSGGLSHAMDVEQPIAPSPKKGHARSRHTLNSWTQIPGMKKTFSIGYRADCEKCRQKVPGHFNHIIVS